MSELGETHPAPSYLLMNHKDGNAKAILACINIYLLHDIAPAHREALEWIRERILGREGEKDSPSRG